MHHFTWSAVYRLVLATCGLSPWPRKSNATTFTLQLNLIINAPKVKLQYYFSAQVFCKISHWLTRSVVSWWGAWIVQPCLPLRGQRRRRHPSPWDKACGPPAKRVPPVLNPDCSLARSSPAPPGCTSSVFVWWCRCSYLRWTKKCTALKWLRAHHAVDLCLVNSTFHLCP